MSGRRRGIAAVVAVVIVSSVVCASAPVSAASRGPGTPGAAATTVRPCDLTVVQVGDRRYRFYYLHGAAGAPVTLTPSEGRRTDVPAASIRTALPANGHIPMGADLMYSVPLILRSGRRVAFTVDLGQQTGDRVSAQDDPGGYGDTVVRAGSLTLRSNGVLVRDDGRVARGYGNLRSLARISADGKTEVHLAALTDGRLVTLTVPTTGPFRLRMQTLRSRGWGHVDTMVAATCGPHGTVLMAVDTRRRRADLFHVGSVRGARAPITRYGRVPGTWVGRLTAGYHESSFADS